MKLFVLSKAEYQKKLLADINTIAGLGSKEHKLNGCGSVKMISKSRRNELYSFCEVEINERVENPTAWAEIFISELINRRIKVFKPFLINSGNGAVLFSTDVDAGVDIDALADFCIEEIPSIERYLSFLVDIHHGKGKEGTRQLLVYHNHMMDEACFEIQGNFQRFTVNQNLKYKEVK
jgi:hypothetical protein